MADLFTLTAPLMIRQPNGEKTVMAAVYPHPDNLLYFDLFWDVMEKTTPWKKPIMWSKGALAATGHGKSGIMSFMF